MAAPSPVPRLADIIEAVELIRSEMAGVTLEAFEPDKPSAGWSSAELKSSPRPAAISATN
jgi:hypothetical protein